jgi:predicted DNA-binding WGR domain protein
MQELNRENRKKEPVELIAEKKKKNYEERKQRQSKIGKCGCVWE